MPISNFSNDFGYVWFCYSKAKKIYKEMKTIDENFVQSKNPKENPSLVDSVSEMKTFDEYVILKENREENPSPVDSDSEVEIFDETSNFSNDFVCLVLFTHTEKIILETFKIKVSKIPTR